MRARASAVFTALALLTIGLILARRWGLSPPAELGGNKSTARASALLMLSFYGAYLALSILRAEGTVDSFNNFLSSYTYNPDCEAA